MGPTCNVRTRPLADKPLPHRPTTSFCAGWARFNVGGRIVELHGKPVREYRAGCPAAPPPSSIRTGSIRSSRCTRSIFFSSQRPQRQGWPLLNVARRRPDRRHLRDDAGTAVKAGSTCFVRKGWGRLRPSDAVERRPFGFLRAPTCGWESRSFLTYAESVSSVFPHRSGGTGPGIRIPAKQEAHAEGAISRRRLCKTT